MGRGGRACTCVATKGEGTLGGGGSFCTGGGSSGGADLGLKGLDLGLLLTDCLEEAVLEPRHVSV